MANPIVVENAKQPTTAWFPTNPATLSEIAGYADQLSYNPGDTVTFYVSTKVNATTYGIKVYRLGWYGGAGGHLVADLGSFTGVAQGYWDQTVQPLAGSSSAVVNCPTLYFDSTTQLVEAGWASSTTWSVPGGATTGIYIAMLTDANGKQAAIRFTVRETTPQADYIYALSDLTSAAYNYWGGFSLYTNTATTPALAQKVSLNRPDGSNYGGGGIYKFDVWMIKFIERMGYNVAYCSNLDLHTGVVSLDNYKAYLSVGHDEYWTYQMRAAVEAALPHGVGLGFFGGNNYYWQMRMENSHGGTANRTCVCYKVGTGNGTNPLTNDPMYGVDNTKVTTYWHDACLNRPEEAILGTSSSTVTPVIFNNINVPLTVDSSAGSLALLAGTGLVAGQSYGYDLCGNEFESMRADSPAGTTALFSTPVTNTNSQADTQNSTYYYHASGAFVFSAGSIAWTRGLDTYRWSTVAGGPLVVPELQQLTKNLMTELIKAKKAKMQPTTLSRFAWHV